MASVLAQALEELGRNEEAFEQTRFAVNQYRGLAGERPEVFGSDLAGSLSEVAVRLKTLGRRDEALSAINEAIGLYRGSEMTHDDRLRRDVARSLTVRSPILSSMGRLEEALASAEEAAGIYRALAVDHPGTIRPELAAVLSNVSIMASQLGRREEALAVGAEAVEIRRALAGRDSDVHRSGLARSLNGHALRLSEAGRYEEALTAINEAVALGRELATESAARFTEDLATLLSTRSGILATRARREEALAAIDEAVTLSRRLAPARPHASRSGLAGMLNNLAARYADLGRYEEAETAAREAVGLYRGLAEEPSEQGQREALLRELAISLNTFASLLSSLGRPAEAVQPARDAVSLLRQLAGRRPVAFRRHLAMSLTTMSNLLCEVGSGEEAAATIDEAVSQYRDLAAGRPEAFRARLATALNDQAAILLELGHAGRALAVIDEAVDIHRVLAVRSPEVFRADLAISLVTMTAVFESLGRADDALAAAGQAITLGAPIAQSAAALRSLLEAPGERRPGSLRTAMANALRAATDQVMAELGLVRSPADRRRILANTAWLVGAGAVFLADETDDPRSAIRWLVAASVAEGTLVASTRSSEFAVLAADWPDLADRLALIVTGRRSEPLIADNDADGHERESLSAVLAEIRRLDGYEDFLRPPSFARLCSRLQRPTAWLIVAPHGAGLLRAGRDGQCAWHRIDVTQQTLAELLNRSLTRGAAESAKLELRAFVDDTIVPGIAALHETGIEVIPVGICAWLPVQSRALARGLRLGLRPGALAVPASPIRLGKPYVAHSDAGEPALPLIHGKREADYVAQLAGVRPDFDPEVTASRVLSAVGNSPLVHLSCHGAAVATNPLQTFLLLGHDRLTVEQLGQRLGQDTAPTFVALSACETALPEALVPEQALGFPSVLLSHGTRAVLGTLWPVYDHVAHDVVTAFYQLWASGKTAGSAIGDAIGAAFHNPLSVSADAFCLQGDQDLPWPLTPRRDAQALPPAHRSGATRSDPGEMMAAISDLELAEYLSAARRYIPEDHVEALAGRVTTWLNEMEEGDRPALTASRQALVEELETLGAGLQGPVKRELGAATVQTDAVQHESPKPDPELVRRLREQYAQQPSR